MVEYFRSDRPSSGPSGKVCTCVNSNMAASVCASIHVHGRNVCEMFWSIVLVITAWSGGV